MKITITLDEEKAKLLLKKLSDNINRLQQVNNLRRINDRFIDINEIRNEFGFPVIKEIADDNNNIG